jgi:ferredoxin
VRLSVDRDKCMGHAVCALMAPDLMKLDDLGYNVTGEIDVEEKDADAARRATGACPESAISIFETEQARG